MSRGRSFFIAMLVVASLFVPLAASAQTITLPTFLERNERMRRDNQKPYWINYRDCIRDDVLHFDLSLTGFLGYDLQVWAGGSEDNCATKAERENQGSCWLVADETPNDMAWRTSVRVQDIVGQLTPSSRMNGPGAAGPEVCDNRSASAGVRINLYFMLVDGTNNIQGQAVIWDKTGYDVTGPSPPTGVSAEPGENKLILKWNATVVADLANYQFYCDTDVALDAGTSQMTQALDAGIDGSVGAGGAGGSAGSSGAGGSSAGSGGAAGSAGSGGAGGSAGSGGAGGSAGSGGGPGDGGLSADGGFVLPANCPSTVLVPGKIPDPALRCGTSGASSSRGFAEGLENGVPYAVGVAAVDDLGNAGPLSQVVCGVPEIVNDFYEIYRSAGGRGGGGFCAVTRAPNGGAAAVAVALAGLLCVARRRLR